jgi:protein-tyrosine kinase
MSRIDQALSRIHQSGLPAQQDADAQPADPWDVSEIAGPAAAAAPTIASAAAADVEPAAHAETAQSPLTFAPEPEPVKASPSVLPVSRLFQEKVVGQHLSPQVVEEYRRLGALIHHMQLERGVRVVMVTSAVAGEGKTLTATNLALVLSASYGRSVLLVDADLRRPSLHQVFNTVSLSGLGDILSGTGETPPLVQLTPKLTLLTAGRPNADPLGGLTSDRMRQLLQEARDTFDFVIIDTPPVGLLTAANLLASMVDVALLVVRATSTPYDLVKRAADAIGRHRIAGVVLNRAQPQHGHNYHYYAGYYGDDREPGRD